MFTQSKKRAADTSRPTSRLDAAEGKENLSAARRALKTGDDYVEAVKWYRLAAWQGHAGAQNNLGVMYSQGQGVPLDDVLSYMWFNLAASRFPPGKDRDKALKGLDLVATLMTSAQIAEAQELAREWRPRSEHPK